MTKTSKTSRKPKPASTPLEWPTYAPTKTDAAYRISTEQENAWLDGHCAGFMGRACPELPGVLGCSAERGYWHGSKARERALAAR